MDGLWWNVECKFTLRYLRNDYILSSELSWENVPKGVKFSEDDSAIVDIKFGTDTVNKKAVLPQGNRAMPQVFFSVEVRQQHSLQV